MIKPINPLPSFLYLFLGLLLPHCLLFSFVYTFPHGGPEKELKEQKVTLVRGVSHAVFATGLLCHSPSLCFGYQQDYTSGQLIYLFYFSSVHLPKTTNPLYPFSERRSNFAVGYLHLGGCSSQY